MEVHLYLEFTQTLFVHFEPLHLQIDRQILRVWRLPVLVGRVERQTASGDLQRILLEELRSVVSHERFVGHAEGVARDLVPVVD